MQSFFVSCLTPKTVFRHAVCHHCGRGIQLNFERNNCFFKRTFVGLQPRGATQMLHDHDLHDTAEFTTVTAPGYTHWQTSAHARIDRVYLSSDLLALPDGYKALPVAFSGYALVTGRLSRCKER